MANCLYPDCKHEVEPDFNKLFHGMLICDKHRPLAEFIVAVTDRERAWKQYCRAIEE